MKCQLYCGMEEEAGEPHESAHDCVSALIRENKGLRTMLRTVYQEISKLTGDVPADNIKLQRLNSSIEQNLKEYNT